MLFKKTWVKHFVLLSLLVCCGVGAEEAAAIPARTDFLAALGHLAADILPIVSVALVMIGGWALNKLAKKLHLDGIINTQSIIDDAVQKGIGYAEKWADKQQNTPTGNQKLDTALKFTDEILKNASVKSYAKDHLEKLTEHFLQQQDATSEIVAAANPSPPTL